ncbi:MAG: lipopolysaccharide biosynthesis protein [Gammaproteobacteria bacterium]
MRVWRESRKFSWAIADQVVVSGGNFVSGILLARLLGIEDFGVYVLAWAIVLFVQSIQFSTISTPMLSIGPKHDTKNVDLFFGGIFLQQIVFGLASALLTWLGTPFAAALFPHAKLEFIAPALATAVLSCQAQDFLRRYFFTTTRPAISFAIDILRYFVQIALLVLYASINSSFNSAMALWIASGAAAFASVAILPCVSPMKWSVEEALKQARSHWHFSKWLTASVLLNWAIGNLSFLFAGTLIGTAAVGGIRAAQYLAGVAHLVIEAAGNVVPPRASSEFVTGGRPKLRAYLQHVTLYGSISIVAVTAIFAFKPEFWLLLVW